MKKLIAFVIVMLYGLTAFSASPPIQFGPGTTNTPGNWTNVVRAAAQTPWVANVNAAHFGISSLDGITNLLSICPFSGTFKLNLADGSIYQSLSPSGDLQFPQGFTAGGALFQGDVDASGRTITAGTFIGNGAALTGIASAPTNFAQGWNLEAGLVKYHAKLGLSATGLVHVVCVGDSITEGYNTLPATGAATSEARFTNGWVGRLRSKLQAQYGGSGPGFLPAFRTGATYAPYDFVYTGGWTAGNVGGYTGGPFNGGRWATAASETITLANVTCVKFEVFYTLNSFSGDNFTVFTNGVLMATVAQTGPATPSATSWMSSSVALSGATIVIKAPGSAKYLMFNGLAVYGSASGVYVDNIGRNGYKATEYAGTEDYFTNAQPALTILTMDSNDYAGQTTLANYNVAVSNILRSATLYNGSAIYNCGPYRTVGQVIPQTSYHTTGINKALGLGCAILSIYDRWNGATSQALFSGDATHPDNPGHFDWANYMTGILTK